MDLCVAMHADQDQMLQIRENYCCACSLYIFKNYGFACIVVVICLFITVFSSVRGTLFMQTLIDDYIIPLTKRLPLISRNSPMRSDALQFSMHVVCLLPLHSPKLWYTSHEGNTPELKKRYVHPYGRTPDPLL